LRARERAERELNMAVGYIAITSRSMGPESCVKTVDWAMRHKDQIILPYAVSDTFSTVATISIAALLGAME
jgi:hypothetical protein